MSLPRSLQDLPPRWAHFCLDIEKFLRQETDLDFTGRPVLVALSGGLDSTALLLVMHYLRQRMGWKVRAAHLDHGLRPDSQDDAMAVAVLCARMNISCGMGREDVAHVAEHLKVGIEEAGRQVRYGFLESQRQAMEAALVAQGHHLNDLAEDVVMRLLRGTGWPSLAGMTAYDPARHMIRPFLTTPKETLREFLTELGATWREDPSNQDQGFLRNRVRARLLPLFIEENPNFLSQVLGLWKLGRLDARMLDDMLPETSIDQGHHAHLANTVLTPMAPAMRLRLYKRTLEDLGPGQPLLDGLLNLEQAWTEARINALIQFPGNKTAQVVADGIRFHGHHCAHTDCCGH